MASDRHATYVFIYICLSFSLPMVNEGASVYDDGFSNDDSGVRLTREYHLRQGALRGLIVKPSRQYDLQLIEMFLGIPYAAPPMGNLRFMPPMMPDPIEHATGLERKELLALQSGDDDPFNMKVLKKAAGTRENPTLVPSCFDARIVGCICEEHATTVSWLWVHKQVSPHETGYYRCVSKKLEGGGYAVGAVEMIVKEAGFSAMDAVKLVAIVVSIIVLISCAVLYYRLRKEWNKYDGRAIVPMDEEEEDGDGDEIYNATTMPGPSQPMPGPSRNQSSEHLLYGIENQGLDTDFNSVFENIQIKSPPSLI